MRLLGSTIFVLVAFLVLASPSTVSAALYPSLVWGETIIQDGGTYSVQINETRPTYVPPNLDVFDIIGNLYKVNGSERDFVESFITGPAPEDGDELFAWTTPGSYELEILELPPPVLFSFETQFVEEPTLLTTIHFTIVDENATPDPVIIIPGILGSEQHNGQWIIDPILHTYDDLIATLDANGYR